MGEDHKTTIRYLDKGFDQPLTAGVRELLEPISGFLDTLTSVHQFVILDKLILLKKIELV